MAGARGGAGAVGLRKGTRCVRDRDRAIVEMTLRQKEEKGK